MVHKRASQKVSCITRVDNANAIGHNLIDQDSRNNITDWHTFTACLIQTIDLFVTLS